MKRNPCSDECRALRPARLRSGELVRVLRENKAREDRVARLNQEAISAHRAGLTWPVRALHLIPRGAFITYVQS